MFSQFQELSGSGITEIPQCVLVLAAAAYTTKFEKSSFLLGHLETDLLFDVGCALGSWVFSRPDSSVFFLTSSAGVEPSSPSVASGVFSAGEKVAASVLALCHVRHFLRLLRLLEHHLPAASVVVVNCSSVLVSILKPLQSIQSGNYDPWL